MLVFTALEHIKVRLTVAEHLILLTFLNRLNTMKNQQLQFLYIEQEK